MMSVRLPTVYETISNANFGAKEQEYVTDEFAIGDPVKTPETKDEKAPEKRKKAKNQPER